MKFSLDARFTMAPESLLFLDGIRGTPSTLSDKAYRLYHVLWAYADRDTQRADITRSMLASAVGCSSKTIDRSLIELEQFGAIEKGARYTASDRQTSNAYIVKTTVPSTLEGWTPMSREGDTHVAPVGDTHVAPGGDTHVAPIQEESPHQDSQGGGHPRPVSIGGFTVKDLATSERMGKLWAEAKGVPFTRSVKRRWLPAVDDFLSNVQASDDTVERFIAWASDSECREPSGWPYWWAKWPGSQQTRHVVDCDLCDNRRYVGVTAAGEVVSVDTPDSTVMKCLSCLQQAEASAS